MFCAMSLGMAEEASIRESAIPTDADGKNLSTSLVPLEEDLAITINSNIGKRSADWKEPQELVGVHVGTRFNSS